jgi:hypothetical protein
MLHVYHRLLFFGYLYLNFAIDNEAFTFPIAFHMRVGPGSKSSQ